MGAYIKENGVMVPVTTEGHPQYYFDTLAQAEAALPQLPEGADVFVKEGSNEDLLPRVEELEDDVVQINSDLSNIKDITDSVNETIIGTYKGDTLYRKVFTGTALTDFNHNIANLHNVYKLEGTFKTNQGYYRAFNFTYALNDTSSPAWYAGIVMTNTQIQFQVGSNIVNDIENWQVTVEYTKSV